MRKVALAVMAFAVVAVYHAASPDGTFGRAQVAEAASAAAANVYSGTISYSRSFTAAAPNACNDNNNSASVTGTETVAEQWQIKFSNAAPGSDADALISGTYHQTIDCPANDQAPGGYYNDTSLSQTGSMTITLEPAANGEFDLTSNFGCPVNVDTHCDGLEGTNSYGPIGGAPTGVSENDAYPVIGIDGSNGVLVAAPGSTTKQVALSVWPSAAEDDPTWTQPGTLTVAIAVSGVLPTTTPATDAPAARCDAYWVQPQHTLSVPAPGVLRNDLSNSNGKLAPKVDHISFGISSHPYSLARTGALRYRATKQMGKAVITYHDVAASGSQSSPTSATIYVSAKAPKLPCGGSTRRTAPPSSGKGNGKGKGNNPTKQRAGQPTTVGRTGGLGLDCGTARINMYANNGDPLVHQADHVCLIVVGNDLANQIYQRALNNPDPNVTYTTVLYGMLAHAALVNDDHLTASAAASDIENASKTLEDAFGPRGLEEGLVVEFDKQLLASEAFDAIADLHDDVGDLQAELAVLTFSLGLIEQDVFNHWIVGGYTTEGAPDPKGCTSILLVHHNGKTQFSGGETILQNLPTSENSPNSYLHRAHVWAKTGGKDRKNFALKCSPDGKAQVDTPRDNNALLIKPRGGVYPIGS